ncbi:hypothetical protein V6N11_018355 [Hibiscus sabdariffa]|uniref:Uncharacterized protein n=1 Tax=Hibiscus sabdariffa TaxID=183260 RepID=A0ABR2T817_9ROSI
MVCFDFLEQCRSASGALVRAMQCSQAGTAPFLSLTLKLYFISFHFLRGEGQRIELPLDLRENRLRQRTWHKPMLQLRESLGIPKFRNDVTRLKGEERGYATNEPGGEGLYLLCLGTKEMNRGVRNHSLQDRSHPPENPMVGSYSYGYEKPGKVTASGKVPAGSSREGVTAKGLLDCRAFFNLNKIVDLDTCVGPANGGGVLLDGSSCSALTLFLPLGPFLSAKDKREI